MNPRRRWIVWATVAAAACATCITLTREREPEVDGRPLSYWLAQFTSYGDGDHRRATIAFRTFGTNAVKWIIPELCAKDFRIKRWLVSPLTHKARPPFRFVPDFERRRRAVRACDALGRDALGALPALEANLDDPDTDNNIDSALAAVGIEGILPLARAALHPDSEISDGAVFSLRAGFRDQADIVVPFLITKLKDGP